MEKLLVVAIAETWSIDKYSLVAYNVDKQQCVNLDIKKNDLWNDATKEFKWDLFGETHCMTPLQQYGKLCSPGGIVKFKGHWLTEEVQSLFRRRAITYKFFVKNQFSWAFIPVNQVQDISISYDNKNKKIKSELTFIDESASRTVLVKDYRWLHYWQSVSEDQIKEKTNYWIQYLNNGSNNIFATAYYHTFIDGHKVPWFNGLHCFPKKN